MSSKQVSDTVRTAALQQSDGKSLTKAEEDDTPIQIKAVVTESVLRYRTKKISDIKHQKIKSPFMSMW